MLSFDLCGREIESLEGQEIALALLYSLYIVLGIHIPFSIAEDLSRYTCLSQSERVLASPIDHGHFDPSLTIL